MKRIWKIVVCLGLALLITPLANSLRLLGIGLSAAKDCDEMMEEIRVGRFAIDLPVETRFHFRHRSDEVGGVELMLVPSEVNISAEALFEKEWDRRLAEIGKLDSPEGIDQVVVETRTIKDGASDMRAVLYYGNSMFNDEFFWDVLVKKGGNLVWFRKSGMQEFQKDILAELLRFARDYRIDADQPVKGGLPWYHLGRGVIERPFCGSEKSSLRFADHSLFTELTINIETTFQVDSGKSLRKAFSWPQRLMYFVGLGVRMQNVRNHTRTVAGMEGEEVIFRGWEKGDEPTLSFKWHYTGEKDSMSKPEIEVEMESADGDLSRKLALWDEMLDSLHFLGAAEAAVSGPASAESEGDATSRSTESGLTIFRANESYGLRNADGSELLPPSYRYIAEFQDGMLLVMKESGDDRKLGLVDGRGKALTPVMYSRMGFFKDGVAIVEWEEPNGTTLGHPTTRNAALIDASGRKKTRESYDEISPFSNGFAIVKSSNGSGYGFINRDGERITKRWYGRVRNFVEGRAIVRVDDRDGDGSGFGVIDETGAEIVAPKYGDIKDFSEGVAVVESANRKQGYLDRSGKLITPLKYQYAHTINHGVGVVTIDGYHGFVDKSGRELTAVDFYHADDKTEPPFLAAKGTPFRGNVHFGAVDDSGGTVIPFEYGNLWRLRNDLIRATRSDGSTGVLNRSGGVIIPFKYSDVDLFGRHALKVRALEDREKVGLVAEDGRTLIPPVFDEIEELSADLVRVAADGKEGVFELSGKVVVPLQYEKVEPSGKYFKVKKGGRYGIVDMSGKEVLPTEYDERMAVFPGSELSIRVEKQGKVGFFGNGAPVVPTHYDYLYRFEDGRFAFRSGATWGFLDQQGRPQAGAGYQSVRGYHGGLARVKRAGKWGYLDLDGKEVVAPRYDYASDPVAGSAFVKEGRKWRILKQPANASQ